jgi:hypothetical protein
MALRAIQGDEIPQMPTTNRPPDAIRPHMRSSQYEVFDRAPHHAEHQACILCEWRDDAHSNF